MILNLADRAGPEDAWAWKREGLEFIDRGLAANTDSYWLRLQRLVRLTTNLGGREEDRRRYRAWGAGRWKRTLSGTRATSRSGTRTSPTSASGPPR
jgi:hypothetical protein